MQTSTIDGQPLADRFPGLTIAISSKDPARPSANSMAFHFEDPGMEMVVRDGYNNIFGFLSYLGLDWTKLLTPFKVAHGSRVALIRDQTDENQVKRGDGYSRVPFLYPTLQAGNVDGIVTNQPVMVAVPGADCPWLLAFDPASRAFGAAHAGWKSVRSGVLKNFVSAFARLDVPPERLQSHLGTGAGKCCYEVGTRLLAAFLDSGIRADGYMYPHADDPANKRMFAQSELIAALLVKYGVLPENIELDPRCTMCTPELHSFRRDRGPDPARDMSGRNMAVISWQPPS